MLIDPDCTCYPSDGDENSTKPDTTKPMTTTQEKTTTSKIATTKSTTNKPDSLATNPTTEVTATETDEDDCSIQCRAMGGEPRDCILVCQGLGLKIRSFTH